MKIPKGTTHIEVVFGYPRKSLVRRIREWFRRPRLEIKMGDSSTLETTGYESSITRKPEDKL